MSRLAPAALVLFALACSEDLVEVAPPPPPVDSVVQFSSRVRVPDSVVRAVLVALYESMDGPNWKRSANWLTDAPLGEWYGVTVGEGGRVIGLHLELNRLKETIPPELGNLSRLENLNLQNNDLTGAIPPELGKLTHLKKLALGNNALEGPIPPEARRSRETGVAVPFRKLLLVGTDPARVGQSREFGAAATALQRAHRLHPAGVRASRQADPVLAQRQRPVRSDPAGASRTR